MKRIGANRYVRNPFCHNWAKDEEGTMEKLQFGSSGKLGGSGRYVDEEIAHELLERVRWPGMVRFAPIVLSLEDITG